VSAAGEPTATAAAITMPAPAANHGVSNSDRTSLNR
jgi:hypothetical protein